MVDRAVDEGVAPLWNPYQGIGAPLAADLPTGAFDPLLVALHVHPTPLVQDMTFLVALLLIGFAAYWLARMLDLGAPAATVTGCIYGLSGWFFEYNNNQFFWTYLYLPIVLSLCEWCLRTNRRLPVVLLGAACASMVFVGMPEIFFVSFVAIAVYAVARLFIGPRVQRRGIAAIRLVAGGALGCAISAPILLLFAEYLPLSYNQHSGLADTPPPTDSVDLVVNWIIPKISPVAAGDYSSTRNWVGAAAIVLARGGVREPTCDAALHRVANRRDGRRAGGPDLWRLARGLDPRAAVLVGDELACLRDAGHRVRSRGPRRSRDPERR